jgi:hypothetical protein
MHFLCRAGTPLFGTQLRAGALEAWHSAEALFAVRRRACPGAECETRSARFAAYLAALDAEAGAAHELARIPPRQAA